MLGERRRPAERQRGAEPGSPRRAAREAASHTARSPRGREPSGGKRGRGGPTWGLALRWWVRCWLFHSVGLTSIRPSLCPNPEGASGRFHPLQGRIEKASSQAGGASGIPGDAQGLAFSACLGKVGAGRRKCGPKLPKNTPCKCTNLPVLNYICKKVVWLRQNRQCRLPRKAIYISPLVVFLAMWFREEINISPDFEKAHPA